MSPEPRSPITASLRSPNKDCEAGDVCIYNGRPQSLHFYVLPFSCLIEIVYVHSSGQEYSASP